MKGIHRALENTDSLGLILLEADLQKEYNDVLKQEEIFWFQKSREKWVKFGDRSMRFFHIQTMVRRKRNRIHGFIVDNGDWCTNTDIMKEECQRFYGQLYATDPSTTPSSPHVPLVPHLSDMGYYALTAPICKEDVRSTIFSMKSYKAPGSRWVPTFVFFF